MEQARMVRGREQEEVRAAVGPMAVQEIRDEVRVEAKARVKARVEVRARAEARVRVEARAKVEDNFYK